MDLREFTRSSASLKFVYSLLGEILPTRYINGFQPTFFPPAPSRALGYAYLLKPF